MIMNTMKLCPDCGSPLSAPEGICPKCLFARAKADSVPVADGFATTVSPEAEPSPKNSIAMGSSDTTGVGNKVQYFGDYELLEEIARGGMGVVYKARQTSLNRIVAVKMILAGQLAGELEVKRFRTEAEAAANLQHPNIVAIHEVGQHEGQHYFSMDFVDGNNLAELVREGPLPAGKAAALVKTIAEAIHYAHQRGTLHRDLKPQNILIDANGQPRITDFGLAKLTQTGSGVTQTGAVMGSPSYMPPEQAAGKQDQVGPASDVYSIGAILYELLTGRAPFRAETPLATMQQVLNGEPIRPSKLNAKTPIDLQTICLKCLEKRPERRYPSAKGLAEELTRCLNREPILARPASGVRRAWSWSLHHPWVITGLASLLILGLIGLTYGLYEQNKYLIWEKSHPGKTKAAGPITANLVFGAMVGVLWMMAMVLTARGLHKYSKKQQSRGCAIHRGIWLAYALLGMTGIVYGITLDLGIIRAHVWEGFSPSQLWATFQLPIGDPSRTFTILVTQAVARGWVFVTMFFAVFVPIWWGATMVWAAVRQWDPAMSVLEDSGRPSRILGFTEDDLCSGGFSSPGLLIVSAALACLALYVFVVSPLNHRFSYFLAGLIIAIAGFAFALWSPTKIAYQRAVRVSGIAFFAIALLGLLPSIQVLVYTAMCFIFSGWSGAALGCFVRRRRKR